jgi:hypothetical protein
MSSNQLSLFGDNFTDHSGDMVAIRSKCPANTSKEQPGHFSPLIPDETAELSRALVPGDRFTDVTQDARTAGFNSRRWASVHVSRDLLAKLEPVLVEKNAGIEMQLDARLWNVLWASWHRSFLDPHVDELQFTIGIDRIRDPRSGEAVQEEVRVHIVILRKEALPLVLIGRPEDFP